MDGGGLADDLPDWWPYPVRCGHGHPWPPGHVIVSCLPCPCRADEGISGHTVVHSLHDRRLPLSLAPPTPPPARRDALRRRRGASRGATVPPAQGDPEPTEAADITAITSHPATAADTSRLAGSRSHRDSALSSNSSPARQDPV